MRGKDCKTDPAHQGMGQRILFTGPDGVGNYRVRLCDFPHHIGIDPLSPEATGDLNYLFRSAPGTPAPLPKNCYVGGVGWGIERGLQLNARNLLSNCQIKRSEFRTAMENRISQIFQNPRQAPAYTSDRQELSAPGNQSVLKNRSQDSNNQTLLSKDSRMMKNIRAAHSCLQDGQPRYSAALSDFEQAGKDALEAMA